MPKYGHFVATALFSSYYNSIGFLYMMPVIFVVFNNSFILLIFDKSDFLYLFTPQMCISLLLSNLHASKCILN